MTGFLVETALLTHGLPSITDEALSEAWPFCEENIAWVERGRTVIGGIAQYLTFRRAGNNSRRIDCRTLDSALKNGLSGALTASGTMLFCRRMGIKMAVTGGMGGIGEIKDERLCPDLPALAEIPVALLSAGPKDMLDVQTTVDWLEQHSVRCGIVNGGESESLYTGYIFKSAEVAVNRMDASAIRLDNGGNLLIINQIPEEKRIEDISILQAGINAGKKAELQGEYYHPAANREFDRLTGGYSSKIQLEALIDNIRLAQTIMKNAI